MQRLRKGFPWVRRGFKRTTAIAVMAFAVLVVFAVMLGNALLRQGTAPETPARVAASMPREAVPSPVAVAEGPPASPAIDIFAVRDWLPPPPPAPVSAPSQPAQAAPPEPPPLPFRFLGRIIEPGQPQMFLLVEGEQLHAVRMGESVGAAYRVESVEGAQLVFSYLPMKVRQKLTMGEPP